MNKTALFALCGCLATGLSALPQESSSAAALATLPVSATPKNDSPRPEPGKVLTLAFPELGPMHGGLPTACEISIPKTYDPAKPVPLLVWFGGGGGSHLTRGANGVVDFDRYVVVALPYPEGRLPRIAAEELRVDEHWTYHRAMLVRIHALLPNLDPRRRIAAGTSSGAHYIGYGFDQQWPGFAEAFTEFVLHEGGTAPISAAIPGAKGRRLLVAWGTRSESIWWREWFNERIALVGADLTLKPIPGAGHGLNDDGRKAIRAWIDALDE